MDAPSRDASNHDTIYRTVGGLDGKSVLYEHTVLKVTSTKVYVDQKPKNGNVLGFYQTRKGAHVLDRKTLEEDGRYSVEYGPTRTSFYLNRSDVEENVETPDPEDEPSSEPEFRTLPIDTLEREVVVHFEQVASTLAARYDEGFSERLLLDVALRQSLVDVQAHGKESSLVQQLDLISMTRAEGPTDSDLHPLPVDKMRTDLIKYLKKTTDALSARYEKELALRRFIEITLRQTFTDLRAYQDEATTIRWLDVLLSER